MIEVLTYVLIAIGVILIAFVIYTNFRGFWGTDDISDTSNIQEQVESEPTGEGEETVVVIKGISVDDAYQAYISDSGYVFVDVRSKSEYDSGHIKGALFIPLSEIEVRLSEIPRDKPVVLYCNGSSCNRSIAAANILIKNGYTEVYDLTGVGVIEWIEKGYPSE